MPTYSDKRQITSTTNQKKANAISRIIVGAYEAYRREFQSITHLAKKNFAKQFWRRVRINAVDRLKLYSKEIDQLEARLHKVLGGDEIADKHLWTLIRSSYARSISRYKDREIAETFFNSVTRRIFTTVGVDEEIEFIWLGGRLPPSHTDTDQQIYNLYLPTYDSKTTIQQILQDFDLGMEFASIENDAVFVSQTMDEHLSNVLHLSDFDAIEMVSEPFYRNKGAYLVGRIRKNNRVIPIILPIVHGESGLFVDAVLLTEKDALLLFNFAHSYFHVNVETPGRLVEFLQSVMPFKPLSELYTALGFNKHGKSLLYQEMYRHLNHSIDKFEAARGIKGMVMIVFTLPSFNVVFKVIRDKFAPPKNTTHQQVRDRYRLVFQHDRAGRMTDAQEFEHIAFNRNRFSQDLLDELIEDASSVVTVTDDEVIFDRLYIEIRLYPLNLYLQEMNHNEANDAVIEYGNAIRDLAAANIFPGDLFSKNFGVTRQGRVILYDFDELCFLTECNFRNFPEPQTYEQEMAAEPWYHVGPNDIFPEEFKTFLWVPQPLRSTFHTQHKDLFQPQFWEMCQQAVEIGELFDVFAYQSQRQPTAEE